MAFRTLCWINHILTSKINNNEYKIPILLFSGVDDPLTPFWAAEKFISKINCIDKTLIWVKNGWHEVFHDIGFETVWEQIFEWIDQWLDKDKKFELPNKNSF